jgi:hypothetical protein
VTLLALQDVQSYLILTVRGETDAFILLSDRAGQPFEIVIGQESSIRALSTNGTAATAQTDGIISPLEDRFFWMSWTVNSISVGRVCAGCLPVRGDGSTCG